MAKQKKVNQPRAWAPRNYTDKDDVVTCRLRTRTREALEAAAERNHRTISAEVAHQLEFALSCQTRTHSLLALVAEAINGLGKMRDRKWAPKHGTQIIQRQIRDDAAFGAASDVTPKFVSPSNPAAQ